MPPTWIFSIFSIIFFTSFNVIFPTAIAQTRVKFLFAVESTAITIEGSIKEILSGVEKELGGDRLKIDAEVIGVDRYDLENSLQKVCAELLRGVTLLLDMTWTGWDKLKDLADDNSIIYERTDSVIISYVDAIVAFLEKKNATDIAFIFDKERDLNESLYHLIGRSILRLVVIDELTVDTVKKIRDMRPSPTYYAIYAETANMEKLFQTAIDGGLVDRSGIWNLVFTDNNYKNFKYISGKANLNVSVGVVTMHPGICCSTIDEKPCDCPPNFEMFPHYFKRLLSCLVVTLIKVIESGDNVEPKPVQCDPKNSTPSLSDKTLENFNTTLLSEIVAPKWKFEVEPMRRVIYYGAAMELMNLENGNLEVIANWSRRQEIYVLPGKEIISAKRYFRVGTTEAIPWSYIKRDPKTGKELKDAKGKYIWEGYCIEFIKALSKQMEFDYDLVVPKEGDFGVKMPDGKWNGLVGDLARGAIDIGIGALTMTSDREDIVDFVAPYFEQSGLLIVMRKPVRETSLFRFMTVLKVEVWLSIVGALTLTGIMIWILDKYSPYSARNNKKIYPYPCREFTLKESFWFALTSFTPQGGGEAPKALSSRTLVAAYWLFVVLMLATFTANLAAFLTVERMQSPVQSLEQLARQSKINYTVKANSSIYEYFQNMNNAEEKLYNLWKGITLNSTSEQTEYRVWDYPIKEQYGHILQAIKQGGLVQSAKEGFDKVIASEKAEFAFIHDSSEIKYEVSRNCNLTEVGEVFAEQPYAIAVQQGSHLQEEISRSILHFQKERYFEQWTGKYWNHSAKGQCPNSDDNEGITLESLGGVFIATLFGLALAMITLAGEVIYYRRKDARQNDKQKEADRALELENEKSIMEKITSNLKMKPAPTMAFVDRPMGPRPRISHISVYPRNFPFKD